MHSLILMAMRDEAAPIVEEGRFIEAHGVLHPRLPMRLFRGNVGQLDVSLVIAGVDNRHGVDNVGSEPAALMAFDAIDRLKPDLVISAGTAGGLSAQGADIGTVYLSQDHFVFHDRHVPLPGLRESAVGRYPAMNVSSMARELALPTGVISTGSSLEKAEKELEQLRATGAVAKEMEAAGIAWVAMLMGKPMLAVKAITNLVDQENQSEVEFTKNFAVAAQALRRELFRVLRYIDGKPIQSL
jgi:adenosylhomocysteine nucleosidase/5'-methylthioadenosine nucleosidase